MAKYILLPLPLPLLLQQLLQQTTTNTIPSIQWRVVSQQQQVLEQYYLVLVMPEHLNMMFLLQSSQAQSLMMLPQPKLKLDLATPEECKAELT